MDISTTPQPDVTTFSDERPSGTYSAIQLEDTSGIIKFQLSTYDTLGGEFSLSKGSLMDLLQFLTELNEKVNPVIPLEQ